MKTFSSTAGRFVQSLTGTFSYSPPPWAAALARWRRNRPGSFWVGLTLVLFLLVGAAAGCGYLLRKPSPLTVTGEISPPGITANVEHPQPDPLRVAFVYDQSRRRPAQPVPESPPSVARLDQVDRKVPGGIRLDPHMPGAWQWEGDHVLSFVPAREWPAGTRFKVHFDRDLFVPEARFERLAYTFATPSFTVELAELSFYQDPRDREVRKAVATLRFSHPVDPASLEERLSMTLRPSGEGMDAPPRRVPFTATYDANRREVYVHSEPLALPERPHYLELALEAGVAPAVGGAPWEEALSGQVLIPDRFSFLKVESVSAGIVRDPADEPQQMLTLRFTDDIAQEELSEKLAAWLLPAENPRGRRRSWQSPREVTPAVLAKADPLALRVVEAEHGFAREYHIPFDVPPGRTLYVRLEPGLASLGGFVRADAWDAVARAPEYPREIRIAAEGALLSLNGQRRLGLMARGLDAFQVRIGKLLPGQLQHLVTQTRGDIHDPHFQHYRFGQENIVAYAEAIVDLKPLHPREANYAAIDLGSHMPTENGRFGLFFVEVHGWDRARGQRIGTAGDRRLILVTDLGLLVKDNADQSHEVFVQSIAHGRPVAGARVSLLGRNGLPILVRNTDQEGHAAFPVTRGFVNEQEPAVYVVESEGDMAFLPFARPERRLNFSRFEVGGVRHRVADGKRLNAFLFTDRGLYRPGETAAVAGIVKSEPLGNIEGIPVEIAVRSPRGSEVASRRLNLPAKGFFEFAYPSRPTSETGTYQVSLYLVRDGQYRDHMIGSCQFRIEEFQPDTLKIQSILVGVKETGWSTADALIARVRLENLFGTPARDRKVTATLHVRAAAFGFDAYQGFTFADPFFDPAKPLVEVKETLPPQTTGADGRAEFTLPLARFSQGTYALTLTTEGFEPGGGRSVMARNRVLISPLEVLVGTKSEGPLDFIHKDAERFIDLVAVGPDLAPRAAGDLTARLAEIRTISTLVKQPDGTYAYQSVEKEEVLETTDLAIPAEGTRFRLPTGRPGTFVWEIIDPRGLRLSRVRFTVAGRGNLLGTLEKNAELTLKLDRADYRAGDTIEMHITAPYTGSGLITVESDRVHAFKWFEADTTSCLATIAIPPDLEGNAYVNVAFVRDAGSREIFTSPLSYAAAPFTIDRSRRILTLDLAAPARVRPGEKMEIAFRTATPSRIAVFAVDEGILQAAGYPTPDPLDHFLQKRALEVETLQMLDLILPEFDLIREISASGGGMREAMAQKALAANLNPFARALEAPAVFWSGIRDADETRRTVSFTVPDTFAGTLRVMAVAVAEGAVGRADCQSLVRGPFVITPALPTQASPGDTFRVSAGIGNLMEGSGRDVPVTVRVDPSEQLEVVGETEQRLAIDEGSEKAVHFQVKAKDRPGAASLRFVVFAGDEQGSRTATLSVRPAAAYATTLASGWEKGGKLTLDVPRRLYPDLAEQTAAASASPLVLIDGLFAYLDHFPHGCTEQVVSQVFPLVGLLKHPAFAARAGDARERVAVLIAALRERQTPSGAFRFWPGGSQAPAFPSVYVMHFLMEVRELGHPVPEDLMNRGRGFLRELAGTLPEQLADARVRAYAIYLLTRGGEVTTNHLVSLQTWLQKAHPASWQRDIAAAYMAATYALLQKEAEADDLIRHYRLGEPAGEGEGVFQTPLTRDAQFVYLLARHFPKRAADLEGDDLLSLTEPVFRGRYHTLSAAYTILALGAVNRPADAAGEEAVRFTAVDADGKARELEEEPAPLPRASLPAGTAKVRIQGDDPLFYLLSQAGFDRALPSAPVREGLEIARDFLGPDGRETDRVGQGEEVTVRLRVRALGAPVDQVAVIDLLPAGFEVVRDAVPREAHGWQADYVDVREDRVIFYGRFDTHARELTYRARATAAGDFVVPPARAEAMYDRAVRAGGVPGRFTVTPAP